MSQHISEEKMQAYFDGQFGQEENAELDEHIRHCPDCSRKFAEYHRLFGVLNTQPEVVLPVNFAKKVLAETLYRKRQFSINALNVIFSAFTLTGLLIIAFYFMDFKRIKGFFPESGSLSLKFSAFIHSLSQIQMDFGGLPILVTGVAVILVIALLDHIMRNNKKFQFFSFLSHSI